MNCNGNISNIIESDQDIQIENIEFNKNSSLYEQFKRCVNDMLLKFKWFYAVDWTFSMFYTKEGLMTITERMDHSLAIFDIDFNEKGLSFKY